MKMFIMMVMAILMMVIVAPATTTSSMMMATNTTLMMIEYKCYHYNYYKQQLLLLLLLLPLALPLPDLQCSFKLHFFYYSTLGRPFVPSCWDLFSKFALGGAGYVCSVFDALIGSTWLPYIQNTLLQLFLNARLKWALVPR